MPRIHPRIAGRRFRGGSGKRLHGALSLGLGAALALLCGSGASAQTAPVSAGIPTQGVPDEFASPDDKQGIQTELVFGRNVKGPYLLSWKGIRTGSEQVLRDSALLHRDEDYTLDTATGTLTFVQPLTTAQIARITYRYDTPDAAPNKSLMLSPIQMDLWQSGLNKLSYKLQAVTAGAQPPSLVNALQFSGGMKLLPTSTLTSGMFFDVGNGDILSHSGLKLAEKTSLKFADFGLAFTRAGALFQQQDASGLKAGNEIMEATGALRPARGLSVALVARQTTELPNNAKGAVTDEYGQTATYAIPKGGTIQAGRSETIVTPAEGQGVDRVSDTVHVDRALSKTTQATVSYDAQSAVPTGADKTGATYSQKTVFGLNVKPNALVTLNGSFQNGLDNTGGQDALKLKMEMLPVAKMRDLKLTTRWEDQFVQSGAQRLREALVQAPTFRLFQTKLSGGIRQTETYDRERLVGLLDATAKAFKAVDATASLRLRDGTLKDGTPDTDAVNTFNLKLAMAVWKWLKLTGSFSHNPEDSDGTIRRSLAHAVGMETAFGIWQIKGQYQYENQYQALREQCGLDLTLGIKLSPYDMLTTQYKSLFTRDTALTGTETYLLSFTHKLNTFFDLTLSGEMDMPETNGNPLWDQTDVKANAKLNVRF